MNLNHLVYFQTLARHEHYRKAAEELHITQPSLSKAIRNMEQDLHVTLFEKSGRGVHLTKQGERYLDYVNAALRELEMGNDAMRYEQFPFSGYMNLGVSLSVATHEFPIWIQGFQKQIGKTVFYSCITDTAEELALELKTGKLDLIVCSSFTDPKIHFTRLVQRPLVLIVPKGHALYGRKSVSIQELNEESFIAHSRYTVMHDILADIYRTNNISVRIISEANSDPVIIAMVCAGIGCGVLNFFPVTVNEQFAAIPVTDSGFQGSVCVGRRKNGTLPKLVQQFYDYLCTSAGISEDAV